LGAVRRVCGRVVWPWSLPISGGFGSGEEGKVR